MIDFKPVSKPKVLKEKWVDVSQIDYSQIKEVVDAWRFLRSYEKAVETWYMWDSTSFAKQLESKWYEIEWLSEYKQEELRGKYIQKVQMEQKNMVAQAKKEKEKKSFLESLKAHAEWRVENIEWIYARAKAWEQTILENPFQMAWEWLWFVWDIAWEAMIRWAKWLYSMLPNFAKEWLEEKAKEIIKKPAIQKWLYYVTQWANTYNKWAEAHPRADANLRSFFNIWEMLLNFKASKIVWETVTKWTMETAWAVKEVWELVTKPLVKWTEKLTTWVLWLTTGTSPDTIRTALKFAGTDDFTKALRWQITDVDVLKNTEKALTNLKNNRRVLYWEWYDKLLESTANVNINDAVDSFWQKLFGKWGFWVSMTDEWLDFTRSTISRGSGQEWVLKNIASDLAKWQTDWDFSPASIDILKKRIWDYYKWSADFAQTDMVVKDITNKLSKSITEAVPEYAQMNAKYSELSDLIDEVASTLSVWNNKNATTWITKLIGTLRRNQEYRQVVLQDLQQFADWNLLAQLAGTALSEWMPRGLAWVIAWWSAIAWATLLSPQFLWWLALASPRVIWELANAVWVTVDFLKKAINNAWEIAKKSLLNNPADVYPIDISSVFGGFQDDTVKQPTLTEMLQESSDEELKANWFTATMIKKLRKQQNIVE